MLKKSLVSKIVMLSICSFLLVSCQGVTCPSREVVKTAVKGIMPVNFEVADVNSVDQVAGICEVVVKVDKQPIVLYIDKKAKYIISGSLLDIRTKKNLTLERQMKYKK